MFAEHLEIERAFLNKMDREQSSQNSMKMFEMIMNSQTPYTDEIQMFNPELSQPHISKTLDSAGAAVACTPSDSHLITLSQIDNEINK